MSVGSAQAILQLMRGELPAHLANPEVWAAWPHRAAPEEIDMINTDSSLKIARVEGIATSFPVEQGVTLGIGRAVKRDASSCKVTTESGLVGWGESHHGRAPGAIAQLINTTLRQLTLGMDAD